MIKRRVFFFSILSVLSKHEKKNNATIVHGVKYILCCIQFSYMWVKGTMKHGHSSVSV